jgi:hypothetical protein
MTDAFTPEERAALAPYFTDLDGPVFALVNLPEVVKGALFARYSRSGKSLRRLFLEEFLHEVGGETPTPSMNDGGGETPPPSPSRLARGATTVPTGRTSRAEALYERVFFE